MPSRLARSVSAGALFRVVKLFYRQDVDMEEVVIKIYVFIRAGSKPNNDNELIRAKFIVEQDFCRFEDIKRRRRTTEILGLSQVHHVIGSLFPRSSWEYTY